MTLLLLLGSQAITRALRCEITFTLELTMAVNVELLQKTLDTIKANPKHWNQRYWHCGTSHCLAGFAELLANNLSVETSEEQVRALKLSELRCSTREYAEELLGISDEDSDVLFYEHNTLKQLERMVAHLIEHGSLEDYIIRPDDCETDADDQ